MTSQQISYVLVLAEEKKFSKAAERLYISQPALSQFIKNVELEVGVPLFDRGTNPLQLTPAGEIYVETAKQMLVFEREMKRKIADLNDLSTGHFVIGTSAFRASSMLPKSVAEFKKRYPGVKIDIITDHVSNLKKMLLDGVIDLCIESDDFDSDIFHSEELILEQYYLAVPADKEILEKYKGYVLTKEDIIEDTENVYTALPIGNELFERFPFVKMKNGTCFANTFETIIEKSNLAFSNIINLSQIETAFQWVNEGLACALMPDTLIRYGNFDSHPLYFKVQKQGMQKPIVVAVKKKRYITHAMNEYITVLRELIGYGTWSVSSK